MEPAAAPQYDKFQDAYDVSRNTSIALIEKENVRSEIEPWIQGARVLELACGSGFYTYDLVKWGAASVLAVDISPVMVAEAERRASFEPDHVKNKVEFLVVDCGDTRTFPGAPFDLVFAAWLLDNACSREQQVKMFRTVFENLKPGGHFVTVTVPPTPDPRAFVHEKNRLFPPPDGAGGVVYKILEEIADGLHILVHGQTPVGKVAIDCYYLRQEVTESAAREAGLQGVMSWTPTVVPQSFLECATAPGGATKQELRNYAFAAQFAVLSTCK